ncbi:MAG TPA: hypothetical protein DDY29_00385 [Rhodobacteraceae bacterium]|jgi:hypothetical protein|nr:ceramidase domain-containing protein [Paracoccaceae bacterium]HBG97234.1 hypothetical protein [Paracoccaceae bacterium]
MEDDSPIAGLTASVDIYCERIDPGFWAEPVNALTNLAFLLAAAFVWPRVRDRAMGRALALILAAIGIASGAFHTTGQVWAAIADSLSIAVFVLVYVFAANRDFLRLGGLALWGMTAAALPAIAGLATFVGAVPFLGSSALYVGVWGLILLYGLGLWFRAPATGRGLLIGAAILALSIGARATDLPLCGAWPLGTHFLWHILNAIMLGWMILVWHRHPVAGGRAAV